jgi:hypothetical protein
LVGKCIKLLFITQNYFFVFFRWYGSASLSFLFVPGNLFFKCINCTICRLFE